MPVKTAHIFPAFVLKYTGKEPGILEKHSYPFASKVRICEDFLQIKISNFDPKTNNYINNELVNQALSYLFATAFSDIIKTQQAKPTFTAGFSMGLYSAMYHCNALGFEDGLQLIISVFNAIKQIMDKRIYKMASVIGFTKEDILTMITKYKTLELVIQNGEFSFVLTGEETELTAAFKQFEYEGAIHLSLFPVNFPYHSKELKPFKTDFRKLVDAISVKKADSTLVSMVNQKELSTSHELKDELINNIIQPLNFYRTIKFIEHKNIGSFIEVGADASLLKSSKFIEGDFEFKSVAKGRVI